jgi:hypothetical protein
MSLLLYCSRIDKKYGCEEFRSVLFLKYWNVEALMSTASESERYLIMRSEPGSIIDATIRSR